MEKRVAKVIAAIDPHAAWATMSMRTLANIGLYGIIIGIATFLLYIGLERFIFEPILCRETDALARCESRQDFSSGVAIVLGSIIGLVLLVRERVYRPILAIIGVAVSLWSVFALVSGLPVVLAAATSTILFGIAYVLFAWLVQPTSLVVSVVGVTLVAMAARLAIG